MNKNAHVERQRREKSEKNAIGSDKSIREKKLTYFAVIDYIKDENMR